MPRRPSAGSSSRPLLASSLRSPAFWLCRNARCGGRAARIRRCSRWRGCAGRARGARLSIIAALCAPLLPAAGAGAISSAPARARFTERTGTSDNSMTSLSREPDDRQSARVTTHRPLSNADVRRIFYGLMLGMFLSALNQTIVATALPTIGRDFGDFENLSWVIIAYLLSSTVVSPLYGKLSDIHGRRSMMLLAIGLFLAGSVVSAAAPDMALLIAGRTLQGIGGGGI